MRLMQREDGTWFVLQFERHCTSLRGFWFWRWNEGIRIAGVTLRWVAQ